MKPQLSAVNQDFAAQCERLHHFESGARLKKPLLSRHRTKAAAKLFFLQNVRLQKFLLLFVPKAPVQRAAHRRFKPSHFVSSRPSSQ